MPAAAGGARGRALAIRPEQPGKAGRADDHGQAQPLAQQLDREIARAGAVQRPRQQADVVERRLVAAQRRLVLGGAIGEIEHRPRQGAAREPAHLVDREAAALQVGRAHQRFRR